MWLGGWSSVAAVLTDLSGRSISRQQVHTWWTRRDRNGFPEGELVYPSTHSTRKIRVFKLEDVFNWYDSYVPSKGGRPTSCLESRTDEP